MKILKCLLMIVTAPVILVLTLFVWLCMGLIYISGLVLGLLSTVSRYDIKGGICMKRNYWALLVFVLIIVLQWIGLGFHGQIRFIFLIIILVLIVLLAILLRK